MLELHRAGTVEALLHLLVLLDLSLVVGVQELLLRHLHLNQLEVFFLLVGHRRAWALGVVQVGVVVLLPGRGVLLNGLHTHVHPLVALVTVNVVALLHSTEVDSFVEVTVSAVSTFSRLVALLAVCVKNSVGLLWSLVKDV